MPMINYRVSPLSVIGKAEFAEASKEELRALLALIELNGCTESEEALAKAAKISVARCKSALTFWEESGVISPSNEPSIIDEFESRLVQGEIDEMPAIEVAETIRDGELADMIEECTRLMNRSCLPTVDVTNLTALHSQYGLSAEYILTLAAHLSSKDELTVRKLCNRAIRLSENGCTEIEMLEEYIKNIEESSAAEWEYRRALGIYDKVLSKSQKEYFKKWSEDFGYSAAIISEAYDVAVLNTKNGRGDLRYMDTVLTGWHNAGCKTVNECREYSASERAKRTAERPAAKKQSKSNPETPRYGDFDILAAFDGAVERSFGSTNDEEGGK